MVAIRVVADDREPDSVISALRLIPEADVSVSRLKLGDYFLDGCLLVERKTLSDFATSVIDGRLFSQAARLSAYKLPAAIILEGKAFDLSATGVSREALQGALISVSLVFGIPVLRSADAAETARLMLYASSQLKGVATGATHRQGRRPRGKRKLQLYILQGLPGIGPEKARRLLHTFGSVDAVFQANAKALKEVSGIGNKTAEAIRGAVSEAEGKYSTAKSKMVGE